MADIDAEQELRKDLAAAYRLMDLEGWSDMIFTHISAQTSSGNKP